MVSAAIAVPVELGFALLVRRLSLAFALSASIALPAAFFYLTYSTLTEHIETLVKVKAGELDELAGGNPNLWQYNLVRIAEALQRDPFPLADERATVRDIAGSALFETGERQDSPVLTRSFPIYDFGRVVGRVDIVHSYRNVVFGTLSAALLGLLLGVVVYTAATLPLRALRRTSAALAVEQGALHQSEALNRKLLDVSADGIWIQSAGIIHYVNDALVKMLGYLSPDEMVGRSIYEFFPLAEAEKVRGRVKVLSEELTPLTVVTKRLHRD